MSPARRPPPVHDALVDLVLGRGRVVVLGGAGLSTASGIPDYRDANGGWKRRPPVTYREFVDREAVRRRYWARSLVGWHVMAGARPNRGHTALARLEDAGVVRHVVTQNVDGLHQRAGSRRVLDLHGRIDEVRCLACGRRTSRAALQVELEARNPGWGPLDGRAAPDGDADLERGAAGFRVPACGACGGILKPAVVFFGESVPRDRVEAAHGLVREAGVLLVAGSSLMVFSGFRFVRAAAARGTPVAILNRGRTRADDLATVKVEADCGQVLAALAARASGSIVRHAPQRSIP